MNTPKIVNIGVDSFIEQARGLTDVLQLDWNPPAWGDPALARVVAQLADSTREGDLGWRIAEANRRALSLVSGARPMIIDIAPARQVIPGMTENTILHAGPPISWERMAGAVQGAVMGALIYEGRASTPEEARQVAATQIIFVPCHERDAVGPMAGIISPSMPVWVVENAVDGKRAYSTMNEGWGRTLRFGAYGEEVIARLRWMEETLAVAMKVGLGKLGPVDAKQLIAQALLMGDECHNRDIAATNLFFKIMLPALVESDLDRRALAETASFLGKHEHFFLNLAMAASKVSLLSAHGIPYSTMVTAIARNGVEVGIRVSGLDEQWFTAAADVPDGLYFPGYSKEDANPDMGDSAITETGGLGAFAMGNAPAIVDFVGGTPESAMELNLDMYRITIGSNDSYRMPNLSFRGTPTGIDVRKVVETGILPVINTGIAHKEAGHGLVGAGTVRAPKGMFLDAMRAFAERYAAGAGLMG